MERRVIVLAGPTCSGKSELAFRLAQELNSEIISADSRQFFRFLDIGTAKPSREMLEKVKHHFIDSLLPDQEYNVSMFETDALKIIDSCHRENKIPIVAGGSGLYIKAVTDGIFDGVEIPAEVRIQLSELRKNYGNEYLYDMLQKCDPESASTMLPQNWKRVLRALEVFQTTGKSIKHFQANYRRNTDFVFYKFALNWDREILYHRINTRVDQMINDGLVSEVEKVLEMGYSSRLNSLNTVGYKEILSFLNGSISLERAIELIKRNTRHLAKRQLTWFRSEPDLIWLDVTPDTATDLLIKKIIQTSLN